MKIAILEDLGLQNMNEIEAAIKRYDIDCDYERTGAIDVATTAHPDSYSEELTRGLPPTSPAWTKC